MENLQILLRGIASGDTTVLKSPKGDYIANQCKGSSLVPKDSVELSIEACLQFELYGEYPLSDCNQRDFDQKVRGAFKLPVKYVEYELVKNINL